MFLHRLCGSQWFSLASALLRRLVEDRLGRLRSPARVVYGQAQYSADNAAGVASIGMRRYLEEHS